MHEPPIETDDASNADAGDDTSLDDDLSRFADALQADLPRLSAEAMRRVEQTVREELERAYPPRRAVVWAWRGLSGMAAALALVVGLAWYIVANTPSNGPAASPRQAGVQHVVDEFEIVIDPALPDAPPDALATPRQRTLMPVAEYDALIGNDRLSQR